MKVFEGNPEHPWVITTLEWLNECVLPFRSLWLMWHTAYRRVFYNKNSQRSQPNVTPAVKNGSVDAVLFMLDASSSRTPLNSAASRLNSS